MEEIYVKIPSYLICYLMYGDLDCVDNTDIQACDKFLREYRLIESCSDHPEFEAFPDIGYGGCDCLIFKAEKIQQ